MEPRPIILSVVLPTGLKEKHIVDELGSLLPWGMAGFIGDCSLCMTRGSITDPGRPEALPYAVSWTYDAQQDNGAAGSRPGWWNNSVSCSVTMVVNKRLCMCQNPGMLGVTGRMAELGDHQQCGPFASQPCVFGV